MANLTFAIVYVSFKMRYKFDRTYKRNRHNINKIFFGKYLAILSTKRSYNF